MKVSSRSAMRIVGGGLAGLVLGTLAALAGWGIYAFAAYWTATNRYGLPRSYGNLSATWRVLGLASSPRVFLIFTFVPVIGFLIGLAAHVWVLITTVVAFRSGLDMDARSASFAAAAGWLPMLLLWALVWLLI